MRDWLTPLHITSLSNNTFNSTCPTIAFSVESLVVCPSGYTTKSLLFTDRVILNHMHQKDKKVPSISHRAQPLVTYFFLMHSNKT